MGNSVCSPRFCRPLGRAISPCSVPPSDAEILATYFQSKVGLEGSDISVYVPFWNGATSIFSLQRVNPRDIPDHAFPEGFELPGETVLPQDVPNELYDLSQTPGYAYSRDLSGEREEQESSLSSRQPLQDELRTPLSEKSEDN